jgi:hypothetical protein
VIQLVQLCGSVSISAMVEATRTAA